MKPDYPRDTDAEHAALVAAHGEPYAIERLKLRVRDYWRNAFKKQIRAVRWSVELILELVAGGAVLTQVQQSRLQQIQDELADMESYLLEDEQGVAAGQDTR